MNQKNDASSSVISLHERKVNNSLSSNDKVIHYLQSSTNNPLIMFEKTSPNNLFSLQQHHLYSSSENDSLSSSSSSVIDSLSRSDISTESSLSDPIAYCSRINSNISSDEDLDFNIGFEQISDDEDDEHILNRHNSDAITLHGETTLDVHLDDIEEYLRQASNSTIFNDDAVVDNHIKQRCTSFLHDSTYTLCSQDRFSAYTDDDDVENQHLTGLGLRSNSFSVLQLDENSTFLETAPKKVVRFADMMGLDLESIRYMTPPDQTTTSIFQECLRLQLGQLRLTKPSLELPNLSKRSASSTSLSSPTKQYNLVSKNFISPINIIPLIYQQKILLECLYTKDSTAYGTIRVHNCSYDKRVLIRLTYDEWKTSNEIEAWHSMNYSHDHTDTFTFEINLPKSMDDIVAPKRILFAVCLQAMSQDFWDNNQGWNYVLDIFEKR